MFVLADTENQGAVIKVVGVGGGGGNAVTHMVNSGIDGVDFVCINTDAQALKHSKVKTSLQIGSNITKGLGAGADPEVGRQAAMEDRDRIVELIEGSDMIFITAGMGGGTGTGAAPIVAQVAKELGILTVAVVTKPFEMEGNKRNTLADQGINELHKYVDSLITIPNQKLLTVLGGDITLLDAFSSANQVLQGAVQGIAELITRPGIINVDFADVRTVMAETGMAMMGSGSASGENRARAAAEAAISSPLLEDVNLSGAHGLLINVTAGMDLRTSEFHIVGDTVKQYASEDATVVVGYVIDPEMSDQIRVTVVATGIGRAQPKAMPQPTSRRRAGWRVAIAAPGRSARATPTSSRRAPPPTPAPAPSVTTSCRPNSATSRTWTSRRSCAARPTDRPTALPRPGESVTGTRGRLCSGPPPGLVAAAPVTAMRLRVPTHERFQHELPQASDFLEECDGALRRAGARRPTQRGGSRPSSRPGPSTTSSATCTCSTSCAEIAARSREEFEAFFGEIVAERQAGHDASRRMPSAGSRAAAVTSCWIAGRRSSSGSRRSRLRSSPTVALPGPVRT